MKTLFGANSDDSSPIMMRDIGSFVSRLQSKSQHTLEGLRKRSWFELHKKSIKKLSSCGLAAIFMTGNAFGTDLNIAESLVQLVRIEHIAHAQTVQAENEQKAFEREEILWLARAIRSETDLAREKHDIAWTIRNRVQNEWYPDTYKEVVLQPYQFSGLNDFDYHYETNIARDFDTDDPVWQSTLEIAREVYYADDSERPFGKGVMHFYSPVAVGTPDWAIGLTPVKESYGARGVRFAFYQGVK